MAYYPNNPNGQATIANSAPVVIASDQSPVTVSGTKSGWYTTTVSGLATAGGATTIKASQGVFGGYAIYNPNSSVAYLQVFQDSSVTLGTTNPIFTLGIPATSAANLVMPYDSGRACALAIKVAATTTAKGSTPPTSGLDATIFYN